VLDLPETTLRTKALYFPVPGTSSPRCAFGARDADADGTNEAADADDTEAVTDGGEGLSGGEHAFNGGIHAAEHGIISLFPFHLLCDRADIGGISTPYHPHTDAPAVFAAPGTGGVGHRAPRPRADRGS